MLAVMRPKLLFMISLLNGCPEPVVESVEPAPQAAASARQLDPPSARPRVRGGAGTWTNDAPAVGADAKTGALCSGCDVVLVTMCSVRRDHVDVYQNRSLTPGLNAVAKGGIILVRLTVPAISLWQA